MNAKVAKIILLIETNDSFEKVFIFFSDFNLSTLKINKENADKIIIDVNNNKYIPLVGSFANECILSIIPDLTINAPNRLIENTNIDNSTVQILRVDDFAET